MRLRAVLRLWVPSTGVHDTKSEATSSLREPADGPSRVVGSIGGYQPGLDGVRALAVLAVAAYHAQLPHSSGGFLGVSLFFTLSGFLITAILLDGHASAGRIDLPTFWSRRFRRLVPAALLGLAVAVVFAATVATRSQLEGFPGEVAAAAAYVSNWFFIANDQSYAELFAAPSPVQHFWSLAIEEQFYVLMPLVLVLLLRFRPTPRTLAILFSVGAGLSAGLMAYRFDRGASLDRLYYGTDTRAAELLVGAALASVVHRVGLERVRGVRRLSGAIGVLALAGLVWSWTAVSFSDAGLWQGGFLLHALGSAAIVVAVLGGWGPLSPFLSLSPLTYLGRISYGIYLFHWPVFLWLDEERTGLGQWPLFALRMVIAVAMAAASYRFLEQPIRRGASMGLPTIGRALIGPAIGLVIIGAAAAATTRDATDELATIRADDSSLGIPIAADDGVLDVVVIGSAATDHVLTAIEARSADEAVLAVVRAAPFTCTGGLVETATGETCANWADEWAGLVEEHDPDAVLLHIGDWEEGRPPGTEGLEGPELVSAVAPILDAGIDLLVANGAPTIWARPGADPEERLIRSQRVLDQTLSALHLERGDVFEVAPARIPDPAEVGEAAYVEAVTETILGDLALYQRSDRVDLPRVLVVGDSQALSLGYGLERWGAETGKAWVWNAALPGCGFADEGSISFFGMNPVSDECRAVAGLLADQIETFDPDLVIALTGIWDLRPRLLADWDEPAVIGDPRFDAYLLEEFTATTELLAGRAAPVVWMTSPCPGANNDRVPPEIREAEADERRELNDRVIEPLAAADSENVRLFDLDDVLCPGGEPLDSVEGVGDIRFDGLHFSVGGARWFASAHGDELLAMRR